MAYRGAGNGEKTLRQLNFRGMSITCWQMNRRQILMTNVKIFLYFALFDTISVCILYGNCFLFDLTWFVRTIPVYVIICYFDWNISWFIDVQWNRPIFDYNKLANWQYIVTTLISVNVCRLTGVICSKNHNMHCSTLLTMFISFIIQAAYQYYEVVFVSISLQKQWRQ